MAPGPARPVAAKLGLAPGQTVALIGAPPGWVPGGLASGIRLVRRKPAGPVDVVLCFSRGRAELERRAPGLAALVGPGTALWLLWPRAAGGHSSDLGDGAVRAVGLSLGLVDVKVAAVGEDWSGLRFVHRRPPRAAGTGGLAGPS